jgi:hypothetical protein
MRKQSNRVSPDNRCADSGRLVTPDLKASDNWVGSLLVPGLPALFRQVEYSAWAPECGMVGPPAVDGLMSGPAGGQAPGPTL